MKLGILKTLAKKLLESKLLNFFGISIINFDLLKYTNHYKWIFKFNKIPNQTIVFNKAKKVQEKDIHLCERLIKAYGEATNDKLQTKDTSQLWETILRERYGKLVSVLESGNPKTLAVTLSSMFLESFVYGLFAGDLVKHSYSKIGKKIWSMKYQDNLLALAEYLGVVRTESPQQGKSAEALKEGVDQLVAKIESSVNTSMNFPDVGAPYGIKGNGSLITMEHPEHFYVALRIHQAVQLYLDGQSGNNLNIMEIGGGFGSLAHWIHKQGRIPINTYTIIDLPIVNVIQGYFLSQAFDPSQVRLYAENPEGKPIFQVFPTQAVDSWDTKIDVLINENSMPEMTNEIVENYLRFARKNVEGIFFSCNHEAYAPIYGTHQVLVPEIAARVSGLTRVSRNASWVRTGYVEETYEINQL